MNNISSHSPQIVHNVVAKEFKDRGLTYQTVAERLGYKSKSSINCAMSSKDYFSLKMAFKLHEVFGFSTNYLVSGDGSLFVDSDIKDKYEAATGQKVWMSEWMWKPEEEIKLLSKVVSDDNLQFALLAYLNGKNDLFFEFVERYTRSKGTYERYQLEIERTRELLSEAHRRYEKEQESRSEKND